MLVILLGVNLQRFLGQRSFGPGAVERMFQKMVLLDEAIEHFNDGSQLLRDFFAITIYRISLDLLFAFPENSTKY